MQFSIWDAISEFNGTLGVDVNVTNCAIESLTGLTMIGSGMTALSGTFTIVDAAAGILDYSGYDAIEECEVAWVEVCLRCTSCNCKLQQFIPFHPAPLSGGLCQGPFTVVPCSTWESACPSGTCVSSLSCLGPPSFQFDFSDNFLNGGASIQQQDLLDALSTWATETSMEYASNCTFGFSGTASNGYRVDLIWDFKTSPGPASHVKVYTPTNDLALEIIGTAGILAPFECDEFCSYRTNLASVSDPNSNTVQGEDFTVALFPSLPIC